MRKKIKFSVLMSVYYKEKENNLDLALNSIFSQSLQPDEVILVEDGVLTKGLYKVIDKYVNENKNIIVIKLKDNSGLANALNEGLKYCRYDYVARMDSDDISLPNRFEKQIGYLEKHLDVDMVGSNIEEYDDNMEKITGYRIVPEKNEEIKVFIKKRNPFNHMSVIYKKEKVLSAGGYVECPFFEDYYLWTRMVIQNCVFYNIQESLLHVRAGLNMIERRGGRKYNKCILNFQKKIKAIGLINKFEYVRNILIRYIASTCPKRVRMWFYKKKLREDK